MIESLPKPIGCGDDIVAPPMRDVAIALPVGDRLHGKAGLLGDCRRPTKLVEDALNYVHEPYISANRIARQVAIRSFYPISRNDTPVPSWQGADMAEARLRSGEGFDRALVRAKMKELGVKQAQLAEEMGLNQSAVSNLLKDPSDPGFRQVKAHEASYIYRRLGIERQPDVHFARIIGMSSAGNWREAIQQTGGVMPVPKSVASDRTFAIEVDGDSMNRIIPEGGYVAVDPDQTQLYNDKVYLIENEEHETQIKLYRSNPARFEPASDNEMHKTIFMGEQPIRVIGRVVWQGSKL